MKMTVLFIACITYLLSQGRATAQEIDNTSSFKNINADRYLQGNLDNDVVNKTDEQYTEGANIELVAPWVKDFPLSKLLIHPFSLQRFGLGIEQADYTPNLLNEYEVPMDRPFAGVLFLKTFVITIDSINKQRFSTTLSTGVIGPASLGEAIQDGFHNLIHDYVPPGWKEQIQNDVILNYEVNYEKQFLSYGHLFSLDGEAMGRVGTLDDKLCPAINMLFGHFESPFNNEHWPDKFKIYIYDHPELDLVAYDATMQGGVFDNSSPYTLPANDISRIVFQNRSGLVMAYRRIYFEYFHVFLTPEFSGGPEHSWDGVQIALLLR
jgi:lipid A 3-O-deacylase